MNYDNELIAICNDYKSLDSTQHLIRDKQKRMGIFCNCGYMVTAELWSYDHS